MSGHSHCQSDAHFLGEVSYLTKEDSESANAVNKILKAICWDTTTIIVLAAIDTDHKVGGCNWKICKRE